MTELEIKDRVAWLYLNNPDKRNALSPELVQSLKEEINSVKNKEEVKVLVLSGRGKAFCAGADLAYLQKLQDFSPEENRKDSESLAELFKLILTFPKPTIALVNGPAIAGGCGLAFACDLIYAIKEATFGFSEVMIGFVPAIVSIIMRKKFGLHTALDLLVSGVFYQGKTLCNRHLINGYYEGLVELKAVVEEVSQHLCDTNSGEAMARTKNLLWNMERPTLEEAMELAIQENAEARLTEDCKKGIDAFLNKKPLSW